MEDLVHKSIDVVEAEFAHKIQYIKAFLNSKQLSNSNNSIFYSVTELCKDTACPKSGRLAASNLSRLGILERKQHWSGGQYRLATNGLKIYGELLSKIEKSNTDRSDISKAIPTTSEISESATVAEKISDELVNSTGVYLEWSFDFDGSTGHKIGKASKSMHSRFKEYLTHNTTSVRFLFLPIESSVILINKEKQYRDLFCDGAEHGYDSKLLIMAIESFSGYVLHKQKQEADIVFLKYANREKTIEIFTPQLAQRLISEIKMHCNRS